MASRSDHDDTPHFKMSTHWHGTFEQIFQAFSPDEWTLEPTDAPMPKEEGWKHFKDRAKVKFLCECENSWTSMRGNITFWFKRIREGKRREVKEKQGEGSEEATKSSETLNVYSLRFKLYGQQCKECDDDKFQLPEWYKEEVNKVLNNVHQKIGETFYKFPKADTNNSIRHGRPRRSHDSARCQACREGQCSSNRGE